ncbi:MAG: bacillithiol biosynthesis cysteine-adding enzyme BshC [Gemmatimonadetes bacterium]|nr:bacillithiol biosynthesis cysteine-adding enzyme BshC [Gemmatimonadota bacterium]
MEHALPRIIVEPFGGGALTRAALDGSTPRDWFLARPRGAEAWRSHAETVRAAFPGARWLESLRPAIAARGLAAERLERVASAHGVVVTTGQQPGLFGGPGYTWLKALTALALADRIEHATGIPAVAVFWAATDDADFAEAAFTTIAIGNTTRRVAIERADPAARVMAQVPLGDISEPMAAFLEATKSAPERRVIDAVQRAYHRDATVGSAYVDLLRDLLEPLGVPVLDSWHPAVRGAARPTLVEALGKAAVIDEAVSMRGVSIERAGYRTQVQRVAKLSMVFRSTDGVKERVPLAHAGDAARRDDLVLSANVLLRPIVERRILPTVAYVGGPGEIAYFAQVGAVAEAMGTPLPLVVPRWSATIVEPGVDRMLGRLGMMVEDVRVPHRAERAIGDRAVAPAVREALHALGQSVEANVSAIANAARAANLSTPEVVEGARHQLRHRVERLERRLRAAAISREAAATRDLGAIRASLHPEGERQERKLNYLPLFARYGEPLITRLRDGAAHHASALIGAR